ncbi:hypothetical protein [Fodinibius halophilus]|uniref:Uncharacterized protein n=1 Tax=Fodinibius halophilus TaxID=1736908 RepID=A0A6M1TKW2_9BACT|nr:hypothetical protein [Fodinibius halophilus]NGP89110.1 hypothetical protein [Fodinibius halophilus]
MKLYKSIFVIGFIAFCWAVLPHSCLGQESAFEFKADPANSAAHSITKHISDIRDGINHPKSWKDLTLDGDHPAIGLLNQAIDKMGITKVRLADTIHMLTLPDGTYEIRDMFVKTAKTDTLEHQILALRFDSDAQLIGVELLSAAKNYQLAFDRKVKATPEARRRVIKQLKTFQNALVEGDKVKVTKFLTDDAYVVVGKIARYYYNDTFGPYYQYAVTRHKTLVSGNVASQQSNPEIRYNNINVYELPPFDDVFVVTFFQEWESENYFDKGYVAMVFDLRDGVRVPVRRWQDTPFDTGYLEVDLSPVTELAVPRLGTFSYSQQKFTSLKVMEDRHEKAKPGFLRRNKRLIILGLGTSAAVTAGAILLTGGDKNTGLPDPPGRPAFR